MLKLTNEIMDEVKKVIVGKDNVIKRVLQVILAGGHILLEDVPGVGKTTMALGFSKAMNLQYKRMQFTPDTMASDIVGYSIYNKDKDTLEYKAGAAMCNLFLADEMNRTSAKTQAALLEVMEEHGMTVDGITHKTPEPFICIATQNPLGSAGTQKLPESQLDRFMVKLSMGYPAVADQINIVKQRQGIDPMDDVKSVADANEILKLKETVNNCYVADDVIEYGAKLCEQTRHVEAIEQGASPRAVLALIQMVKANAVLDEREYVIPEDIRSNFIDVCAHRMELTAKARIRKETAADLLEKVLAEIKPPTIENPEPTK